MRLKYSLLICFSILLGAGMTGKPKTAQFQYGITKIIKQFNVDSKGGTFKISETDTPINNISIEIPPEALEKEITISIGYNDGKLIPRTGKSSGVIIVIESDKKTALFRKHITITIPYDISINPKCIIAYQIDKNGKLHTVDTGKMDSEFGTVSFYSFKTLMMTWVYIF